MKITVLGAAGGEVTGSAYLVQTDQVQVLIDFGMFQGSRAVEKLNRLPKPLKIANLSAVLLTHGHLDHVGRLPLLARAGYRGPIFASAATHELAELILEDAARLQAQDIERENRKRRRQGMEPIPVPFDSEDVKRIRALGKDVPFGKSVEIARGISARWREAGHMLGSGSIELTVQDRERTKIVVFSGDIGPRGAPFLRDPEPFTGADLVFLESTYGDRNHKPLADTIKEALEITRHAIAHKGKILVPTFAVGRAQNLMYMLSAAFRDKQLPLFPVYLDSPMAIEATAIYGRHKNLFDQEALDLAASGHLATSLKRIIACPTRADSQALNEQQGPCMILAGNGMCSGGRILHHLRYNLANPSTVVMIVGYQSAGSIGRQLVDGEKFVQIFGERIPVRAKVHTLGGLSAHAGQSELADWFGKIAPSKPRVILTHGEDRARLPFAKLLKAKFGAKSTLPSLDEVIEI